MTSQKKPSLGEKITEYRVYYVSTNTCVYRSESFKDAKTMAEFWHRYEADHGTEQQIVVRKYVIRHAYTAGQSFD